MDSNFITASQRRKDLAKEREKVDMEICKQYQQWLIDQISRYNMNYAKHAHLPVLDKIKSCMRYVKLSLIVYERSTHGIGYRRYCDDLERKRFVDMLGQIVDNSDYVRKLVDLCLNANGDPKPNIPPEVIKLIHKYKKLKEWIRLLENTEESNFYNSERKTKY